MSRGRRYLRTHRPTAWDAVPRDPNEIQRTEHEQARRATLDWLRERSDEDRPEWDEGESEDFV